MGVGTRCGVVAATAWLTLGANLSGQREEQKTPAHEHTAYDLMAASREQCDLAVAELTDLSRVLADARRADDAVHLRAAVIASERPLTEVKQHLGSCLDIMKMVQRGIDDGHAGSHDAAPVKTPEAAPKAPAAR